MSKNFLSPSGGKPERWPFWYIWRSLLFLKIFWGYPFGAKVLVNHGVGYDKKFQNLFIFSKSFVRGLFWCFWKFLLSKKLCLTGLSHFSSVFLSDSTETFRRENSSVFLKNFWNQKCVLCIRGLSGFSDEKVSSHITANFPRRDLLVFEST